MIDLAETWRIELSASELWAMYWNDRECCDNCRAGSADCDVNPFAIKEPTKADIAAHLMRIGECP